MTAGLPNRHSDLPDLRIAAVLREGRWKRRRNEYTGRQWRNLSFQERCKHKRTVWERDGSQTCERCGQGGLVTVWL